nr:unnamed protein product [Digitaria exilis]
MDPSGSASRQGRLLISPSLSTPTFSTRSASPSPAASPAPHHHHHERRNSTSSPKPLVPFPSSSSSAGGTYRPRSSTGGGAGPRGAGASASSAPGAAFAHNARLAAALVPAAAFLLDLGGLPVFAVLAIGLAAAYLLDALQLRQGAFFTVWAALIAADVAFFFSASLSSAAAASLPLTTLALLLCAQTSFLIGVWASLQFRWIQLENPTIVVALERLLFACVPIAAPALFTWALVSAVGMANASYYFAAFCMVFYWLFSIPRPSSFNNRKQDAPMQDSDGILGPLESCVHSLYLLFVPVLFHAASHHATLFTSWGSVCELLLLFFIPFLFQLYASTRGALWWVSRDARTMDQIRIANGLVALVVVVLCLEVRVVFHSFGRYIHAPPPLNYLLVTITMLGGALGLAAHAAGKVGDAASSAAFTVLAVLVSGAGAVVIGFPVVSAKRFLVLVVATGLLFVIMQPPIKLSWVYRSELITAAHLSDDDTSIYGFVASKPTWPSWLLIVTVVLTLAAVTSIIPVKYVVELRALYAVAVGVTLGIYISVQYFFQALVLYPLLVATVVAAAVFVVFTHLPSESSTRVLPWVFSFLVALFPVTYLLEGQLRAKSFADEDEAEKFTNMLAIEGARMSLLGLYAAIFMIVGLEIKFELALLLRDKAADRGVAHGPSSRSSAFPPKARLLQQRRAHAAPTFTIKRLEAEAAWMPAIGNVSTVLCFIICLVLNMTLTGGSNRAIFFLAPILLLLNQDSDIFAGFGDRQRYFPHGRIKTSDQSIATDEELCGGKLLRVHVHEAASSWSLHAASAAATHSLHLRCHAQSPPRGLKRRHHAGRDILVAALAVAAPPVAWPSPRGTLSRSSLITAPAAAAAPASTLSALRLLSPRPRARLVLPAPARQVLLPHPQLDTRRASSTEEPRPSTSARAVAAVMETRITPRKAAADHAEEGRRGGGRTRPWR